MAKSMLKVLEKYKNTLIFVIMLLVYPECLVDGSFHLSVSFAPARHVTLLKLLNTNCVLHN